MTAPTTPAGDGPVLAAPGGLWFESPTQDELRARLAALDAARHAGHGQPAWFCPLCPPPRGTGTQTSAGRAGGSSRPAEHHPCPTCGGYGVTDDGDRLCPECRPVRR